MQPLATPATIGRYRILGELATGGMAEILLARVDGPGGFSRPVVIKRVLPHLARQRSFLSMFLDEARIIAGIRHPNVVHVQELVDDDAQLFLVMEYLAGETVSGLMKRLRASNRFLAPQLAAHIVAELCAGLHAAHELEDDQGVALMLVHRDVSPQNAFVTYDGHVKLLDFGIALARDRTTRTEVGELKGKLQYMSPEQCEGLPLDRRSDIFALGIVLYELATGRLLFKRDSAPATLYAICDEPVLPPSRIAASCPTALDAICVRALARDRDRRFATCLEMRAALLDFLDTAPRRGVADQDLAALMRELFADRTAEKLALLRNVERGAEVIQVPAGEVDQLVEMPTVADQLAVAAPGRASSPRRRSRWLLGCGLVVVVAMAATGAVVVERQLRTAGADDTGAASPRPAPPAVTATAPAPVDSVAAAPVTIEVVSVPAGASVRVGGEDLSRPAPVTLELARSSDPVELELRLAGYVTQRRELVPDRAQRVEIALPERRRRRSGGPEKIENPARPGTGAKPEKPAHRAEGFRRFE